MKLLGHRGARHEAPENTLGSIERALRAGVEGIEVDVHLSADGRVVVIHDETVDRTCPPARGRVDALRWAELRALDAGQGERIPSLEEVLDLVRERAELFVELKVPGSEPALVDVLRAQDALERCLVKAFDHRLVARTKSLAPGLRAGCLLVGRPVDPVGVVRAAGADFLSLNVHFVDADLVAECHAAGLFVCAWNCNDPRELPALRATGIDWLGTDAPTTLVPAAREG